MKITGLFLLCCALLSGSVFANMGIKEDTQKKAIESELIQHIYYKTFSEAVQEIRNNFKKLASQHDDNFPGINFRITATSSEPLYAETINLPNRQDIESMVTKSINNITFKQSIVGDQSYINIDSMKNNFERFFTDYDNYHFKEPTIVIKKIFYQDGTDMEVNLTDENVAFLINSNKQIIALDIDVEYLVPKTPVKKYTFSNNSKINNDILLTSLQNDNASFIMTVDVSQKILTVEGIDVKNRAIQSSGSNSYQFNSEVTNNSKLFYLKLLTNIDEHKITDKESLINYIKQHHIELSTNYNIMILNKQYRFYGDLNAINIYLLEESSPDVVHYQTKIKPYKNDYINGVTIGYDKNYEKVGFINQKGEWIIEPKYDVISHRVDNYYLITSGQDDIALYLVDSNNKKIQKQPFFIMNTDIYQDRFVIINQDLNSNHRKGLLDIKNHKIIKSPVYPELTISDNFYMVKYLDLDHVKDYKPKPPSDIYQVYNLTNNRKLYSGEDRPTFDKDIFIVMGNTCQNKTENKTNNQQDCHKGYYLYNSDGKKLNQQAVTDFEERFSANGLLLVSINEQPFFINRQGKKLNINLRDYQQVNPFSNGLAAVQCRSNELYGYINAKGQRVIPCMYYRAHYFQSSSAIVMTKPDNKYQLIRPDNSIIKKFTEDSLSSYSNSQETVSPTYTLEIYAKDENTQDSYIKYNHKGEVIKEYTLEK